MFNENDVITDGTTTGTVKFSSETFTVVETASGEVVLNSDTLGAWSAASETSSRRSIGGPEPALTQRLPWCPFRRRSSMR